MPLNFTGRLPPPAEPPPSPGRLPVVALAGFGLAALMAGLVFAVALRQHKADAPPPLPPLVGQDRAPQVAVAAQPSAAAPRDATPLPAAEPAPSQPKAEDRDAVAKAKMLAALRQVPHGVVTLSIEDDPVAQAYGDKLKALFREAGWTVDEISSFGSGPPRRGIAAAFGVSPNDEAVREAFDAVGFQFLPPPRDAGITQTPEIFVGRPPSGTPARPSPAPKPDRRL